MTSPYQMSAQGLQEDSYKRYLRYAADFILRWNPVAKITYMDAIMRSLTVVRPFMQTALDTQKMTGCTLHLAKLNICLKIHSGALKCPSQLFNICMGGLESKEICRNPFTHVIDT